jgi:hypothetical protein
MAQAIELLLNRCKTLSSNPSTKKEEEEEEEKEEEEEEENGLEQKVSWAFGTLRRQESLEQLRA